MTKKMTFAKAKEVAKMIAGTSKSLEKCKGTVIPVYKMQIGLMTIYIRYGGQKNIRVTIYMTESSMTKFYDFDTLEEDYCAGDRDRKDRREEIVESWIYEIGAKACKAKIDELSSKNN